MYLDGVLVRDIARRYSRSVVAINNAVKRARWNGVFSGYQVEEWECDGVVGSMKELAEHYNLKVDALQARGRLGKMDLHRTGRIIIRDKKKEAVLNG